MPGKPNSFLWLYLILAIAAILVAGLGWHMVSAGQAIHSINESALGWGLMGAGAVLAAAMLVSLPLALNLEAARETDWDHQQQVFAKLNDRLEQICLLLNMVTENQLISDRTKALAFRDKDRDAVRRAVQEEISRQDWE